MIVNGEKVFIDKDRIRKEKRRKKRDAKREKQIKQLLNGKRLLNVLKILTPMIVEDSLLMLRYLHLVKVNLKMVLSMVKELKTLSLLSLIINLSLDKVNVD